MIDCALIETTNILGVADTLMMSVTKWDLGAVAFKAVIYKVSHISILNSHNDNGDYNFTLSRETVSGRNVDLSLDN